MKKLKIVIILLAGLATTFYACKKEEVTDQQSAQAKLVGRWPLKYRIRTVTNGFTIKMDSTLYSPVDTLVFTADGKFVKQNKTIIASGTYTIDEAGENITFSGSPALTQKLNYVRVNTIGLLVSEATTTQGGVKVNTLIIDQLSKF